MEEPQPPQLDQGTAGYSAPTPTGTYTGGANSIGLRLGGLRIPEINIPLPTLQLPHLVFLHRTPEVALDSATAPIHRNGEVHDFAQVDSPPVQLDQGKKDAEQPPQLDQPNRCCPPPNCCPPVPGEGCTTWLDNSVPDWKSPAEMELAKRQREIEQLHVEIAALQKAVSRMVDSNSSRREHRAQPLDGTPRLDWSHSAPEQIPPSVESQGSPSRPLESNDEEISALEDRIRQLKREKHPAMVRSQRMAESESDSATGHKSTRSSELQEVKSSAKERKNGQAKTSPEKAPQTTLFAKLTSPWRRR